MDQALQIFSQKTDSVLSYLKNQIGSFGLWQNIPGNLTKVSSSSSGYVWGIQNKAIWYCREPCASGNWTSIGVPDSLIDIKDVTTDTSSVYILFEAKVDTPAPPPPEPTPPPPQPEMIPTTKDMLTYPQLVEASAPSADIKQYTEQGDTTSFFTRLVISYNVKTKLDYAAWLNNPEYKADAARLLTMPLVPLPSKIQKEVDPLALAKLLDSAVVFKLPSRINENAAQRALIATNNDPAAAFTWIRTNANDPNVNADFPAFTPGPTPPPVPAKTPPPTPAPSPFKWASRAVDGSGSWSVYDAPFNADSFVNTNGFLWISGKGRTAFCAKPCTTGNWNTQERAYSLKGASSTSVYASQPGQLGVLKADETAQTGWAQVPGLESMDVNTLGAEGDSTALYAADGRKMYRCEGGTCATVDTQGYLPLQTKGSLSVNPTTRNVWMVSGTSGNQGNLFARLDTPDTAPILDYVSQTDEQRDRIVNSLGDAIQVQTAQQASRIARKDAVEAIKRVTDISSQQDALTNETEVLQRQVSTAKNTSAGFSDKLKPLTILLVALVVTVVLYLTIGWFLPHTAMMIVAFLTLGAGFGGAIYFSVKK